MSAGQPTFFQQLPLRAATVFYSAVFFTFAPMSLLLISAPTIERPLTALAATGIVSGLVAVSWAATFSLSKRFAIAIVVTTAATIALSGPFASTRFGAQRPDMSIEGLATVVSIVTGYVLFIVFIAGQGRTTLRLVTEMGLARDIHETLVPPIDRSTPAFEVLAVSRASSEMGGDLVEVVEHDGSTDLYVADVSGHGVRAGVVMGMVKAAIHTGAPGGKTLAELLTELNRVLEATTSAELYATMAVVRRRPGADRVEFALAGHHHIVRRRAADGVVDRWEARAFPLGLMPGVDFEAGCADVAPGDLLVVYTDGLNETEDADEVELGHEAIERIVAESGDGPLSELRTRLYERVDRHGAQVDDQSLLLARVV